eukprot:gene18847-6224_t
MDSAGSSDSSALEEAEDGDVHCRSSPEAVKQQSFQEVRQAVSGVARACSPDAFDFTCRPSDSGGYSRQSSGAAANQEPTSGESWEAETSNSCDENKCKYGVYAYQMNIPTDTTLMPFPLRPMLMLAVVLLHYQIRTIRFRIMLDDTVCCCFQQVKGLGYSYEPSLLKAAVNRHSVL